MSSRRKNQNQRKLPPPKPFSEEWIILKIMEQWTPEDVEKAIDNDVSLVQPIISLLDNNGVLSTIAKYLFKKHSDKLELLTVENVLLWVENRRPDLCRALKSPKGVNWLSRNVDGLRKAIEKKLYSLENTI